MVTDFLATFPAPVSDFLLLQPLALHQLIIDTSNPTRHYPSPVICNFNVFFSTDSLMLPAIHGVIGMVATLISTPYLGAWIDLSSRLKVATTICLAQATVVTVSSVLLALFLHFQDAIITQQVHSAGFNDSPKHYFVRRAGWSYSS